MTAALADRYYLPEGRLQTAIARRGSFNLIHLETAFKVDVFVILATPFARTAMARRVSLEIPELGRRIDFCSPEDIVLHKLQWYEMGHRVSDRQWQDLEGVLRLQGGEIDVAHLRRWASELGLEELLEQALDEAGL